VSARAGVAKADHGRLKSRLRSMRDLTRLHATRVISTGHTFVQNLRRGHYELALDLDPNHRLPAASPNWPSPSQQHTGCHRPCPPSANATAPPRMHWLR
jgi:transposase, IS6 family